MHSAVKKQHLSSWLRLEEQNEYELHLILKLAQSSVISLTIFLSKYQTIELFLLQASSVLILCIEPKHFPDNGA
jgi:hypothetical protein